MLLDKFVPGGAYRCGYGKISVASAFSWWPGFILSDVNSRLSQLERYDDIGGQVDGMTIAGSGLEFDLLCFMRSLLIQAVPQPADYVLYHHLTVSHESYAQDNVALHP